jgi:DNA-binding LacI/PurR family transcriptional regulator
MSTGSRQDGVEKVAGIRRADFSALFDLPSAGDTPKHELFRQHFLENVRNGHLQPGQAIPSEQRIAELLEFSRTTVRHTLAALEREGFIRRVQGKGTFVHEEARKRLRKQLDILGLVVPNTIEASYPSLLEGFQTAAGEGHRQVIVCSTHNDLTAQSDAILQLLDKDVAGVAIVPSAQAVTPPYQIRQIWKQGVPVVFCHRGVDGIDAPQILIPYRRVGRLAGDAFAERGHRRVAMFVHRPSDASREYEAGLRSAMRHVGSDLDESFIYRGDRETPELHDQEKAIAEALGRMLSSREPPTAIMTSFDSVGEMVYLLLNRLRVKVPEEVSLISFGGTRRSTTIQRSLTCVAVDEGEIGRRAAVLLAQMSDGQRSLEDNEQVVMPLSIYEGKTLGPATK